MLLEERGHLRGREREASLPILAVEVGRQVVTRLLGPLDHHELAEWVPALPLMYPECEHLEERRGGAIQHVLEKLRALDITCEGLALRVKRAQQRAAPRVPDGLDERIERGERAAGGLHEVAELR